jgi:hypothetical protein
MFSNRFTTRIFYCDKCKWKTSGIIIVKIDSEFRICPGCKKPTGIKIKTEGGD